MTKNVPQTQHLDTTRRPNRIPVDGPRNILSIPDQDPNFHYTWQVDGPGTLERFLTAGYEFVTDPGLVGDPSVQKPSRLNGMGTARTCKSGADTLYAMRQRMDWYLEDRKAYEDMVDGKEKEVSRPIEDAGYGGVKTSSQSPHPQGKGHRL